MKKAHNLNNRVVPKPAIDASPQFPTLTPFPAMKYALSNSCITKLPFEDQCELTARLGFSGILITPSLVSPQGDAKRHQAAYGEFLLETAQFHGLEIFGFEDLLSGSDGAEGAPFSLGKNALDSPLPAYLQHLAELCYACEGKQLILGSPIERTFSADSANEEISQSIAHLHTLAEFCEKRQIELLIDPSPTRQTNFVNSAQDAAVLLRELDSPACALQLNTDALALELDPDTPSNPLAEGETATPEHLAHYTRELIHFHRERLQHFQILANEELELLPSALALREIEFAGCVSLRPPLASVSVENQDSAAQLLSKTRALLG